MRINVIKVDNKYAPYYIGKISGKKLQEISKTDIRQLWDNHDSIGIQRHLYRPKVIQIGRYIDSNQAVFPNAIIISIDKEYIIEENDNFLEIVDSPKVVRIIDGQHRVEAFFDSINDFDLLVSIFIDLPQYKMSDIFKTINSTQKPLDPSLKEELESDCPFMTPEKMCVIVAKELAFSDNSPLFQRIKFYNHSYGINDKKATLTLASFITELLGIIYVKETHYNGLKSHLQLAYEQSTDHKTAVCGYEEHMKIDQYKYVLWKYYKNNEKGSIVKIIYNYFDAVKTIFRRDYSNMDSILMKTIGFRALMSLFVDVYNEGYNQKQLTYDFFVNRIRGLEWFDGRLNSDNYPGSSYSLATFIYNEFKRQINMK